MYMRYTVYPHLLIGISLKEISARTKALNERKITVAIKINIAKYFALGKSKHFW